jgi:hypothetical protein
LTPARGGVAIFGVAGAQACRSHTSRSRMSTRREASPCIRDSPSSPRVECRSRSVFAGVFRAT